MAIAFVPSSAAIINAGSGSSKTMAYAAADTAGNFVLIAVATFGSGLTVSSVVDSKGQNGVQIGPYAPDGSPTPSTKCSLWAIPNTAGGATSVTVTLSGSSGGIAVAMLEYSGVASASYLDASTTGHDPNAATSPITTGTCTTAAGELIVAAFAQGSANLATCPVSSPFTDRKQALNGGSVMGLCTADDVGAAGSAGATWTPSGSVRYGAIAVSLVPAASGGGGGAKWPGWYLDVGLCGGLCAHGMGGA